MPQPGKTPDGSESLASRTGLWITYGLFVGIGFLANCVLSIVLPMSSDGCASGSTRWICSADAQLIAAVLPWVFLAVTATTAAVGIARRSNDVGFTILLASIAGYMLGSMILLQVVS